MSKSLLFKSTEHVIILFFMTLNSLLHYKHILCFIGKVTNTILSVIFVKHESWSTTHAFSELNQCQGCFLEFVPNFEFRCRAVQLVISFSLTRNDQIYLNIRWLGTWNYTFTSVWLIQDAYFIVPKHRFLPLTCRIF